MATPSLFRQQNMPSQPSDFLRDVVKQNRWRELVGTYAVCSAHPAFLNAAACGA
jgi:hypothetical protein